MRPFAQRFGEWASASRTFSAITDLLAVVQREVASCLSSFSCPCMLRLPAESLSVAATCSPTRHHHQTTTGSWRWRALSPYATAASQRQLGAACVTVQAPFTSCSLWHDHDPIAVCLLRESPCFTGRPPEHEHCSGKYSRQRFLCGKTSTFFFLFISETVQY